MGRAEKRLFNGRISEIVRTYICWQIYESAFLLKWGKLLRRRGCCCCCPWLWGCNGAGERGSSPRGWWWSRRRRGETYALHPSGSRSCALLSVLPPATPSTRSPSAPPRRPVHPLGTKDSLTLSFSSSADPHGLRPSPSRPRSPRNPRPTPGSVSHRCNFPVGDLCDIKVCVVYLTATPPSAALIYRNICRTILPPLFSRGCSLGLPPRLIRSETILPGGEIGS